MSEVTCSTGWKLLLAALSGALYAGASPPGELWPLAFISWVPLLIALRDERPARAALLGATQGVVANAIGLSWLPPVVQTFGNAPRAVCIAISVTVYAYNSGAVAFAALLFVRARGARLADWCSFPLAVAATEAFFPLIFPSFTASQVHSSPILMQLADIGGPILVGVPLTIANVAVAGLVVALYEKRPPRVAPLLVCSTAVGTALVYGDWRMREVDATLLSAPALRVGIVQANTPHQRMGLKTAIRTYRTKSTEFKEPVDLVVWPETALSAGVQTTVLEKTLSEQVLHTPEFPAPPPFAVLSGIVLARGTALSNAAVLFTPDGLLRGTYEKVHPLVFGEYVPLGDIFPRLQLLIPNAGRLTPGASDQPAIEFAGHRITPLICYEDAVPAFTDERVHATSGELLIDLTNDSWFGKSKAAAMHLGLAKFRAVEQRRYLVHAATSGISAFVDPLGRTIQSAAVETEAILTEQVRWLDGETVYARTGELPRSILALLTLALLALGGGGRRASREGLAAAQTTP